MAAIAAVNRDLYASLDDHDGLLTLNRSVEAMLAWSAARPNAARWMYRSYAELLGTFIASSRLKRLLTTIAEYVTDQPHRLTVGEMAPLFSYYFEGGFYPTGGSQKLANLLRASIEQHGGGIRLRTLATRLLFEQDRIVGVVTASGMIHRAPLVIANGDVVTALTNFTGACPLPVRYFQRVRNLRRGPSAILVSLGLNFVPDLPARVFVSAQNLHFGIGNPSAIDPSLAPPACAALTLLCLLSEEEAADWFSIDQRVYRQSKEAFADRLLAASETVIPGLVKGILYRQAAAPPPSPATPRPGMATSTAQRAASGVRLPNHPYRGCCWLAPDAAMVPASKLR